MIKNVLNEGRVPVKIWTDEIEDEAKSQLISLSKLPFIFKHVAVMPDVHAGKGSTVGTVFATKDVVIPSTVGVDIGCGMAAIKTPYMIEQINTSHQLEQLRHYIERSVPVGFGQHKDAKYAETADLEDLWTEFEENVSSDVQSLILKAQAQLGTLGGGNHFIEICADTDGCVWIMLHSGSRNIGKEIASLHIKKAQSLMGEFYIELPDKDLAFFPTSHDAGIQYITDMEWAQRYAYENRKLMLKLVSSQLAYIVDGTRFFYPLEEVNCHHNYMSLENHFGQNVWVTRKGAIRARKGDKGIIPGSMGTRSYITEGLGEEQSFTSASHGAGRKMSRSAAKKMFTEADVELQTKGIVCRKDGGIIDELPGAYKSIDTVMDNEKDLVTPIHELRQLICIKG